MINTFIIKSENHLFFFLLRTYIKAQYNTTFSVQYFKLLHKNKCKVVLHRLKPIWFFFDVT